MIPPRPTPDTRPLAAGSDREPAVAVRGSHVARIAPLVIAAAGLLVFVAVASAHGFSHGAFGSTFGGLVLIASIAAVARATLDDVPAACAILSIAFLAGFIADCATGGPLGVWTLLAVLAAVMSSRPEARELAAEAIVSAATAGAAICLAVIERGAALLITGPEALKEPIEASIAGAAGMLIGAILITGTVRRLVVLTVEAGLKQRETRPRFVPSRVP